MAQASDDKVKTGVTREDFPARPYGQRAWEIHCETGAHPFEALAKARDEEGGIGRVVWPRPTLLQQIVGWLIR